MAHFRLLKSLSLSNYRYTYDLNNPTVNYTDYVISIRKQQNRSIYPKLDDALSYPFPPFSINELANIVKSDSFVYCGSKVVSGTSYWEFCKKGSTLETSDFIYIPITYNNFYNYKLPLPTLKSWTSTCTNNFCVPAVANTYPQPNLLSFNKEALPAPYKLESLDLTHPFLPGFYYVGRTYLVDNFLYYEYFDNLGLYGPLYEVYLSNLRPIDLDFPIGIPKSTTLDNCFPNSINYYPQEGSENEAFEFTGYSYTIDTVKFYIYQKLDSTLVSLLSPPQLNLNPLYNASDSIGLSFNLTATTTLTTTREVSLSINITST